MNLNRISIADLHALKSLRGLPEFKRLWGEEFASQVAMRETKIAAMETEEARLLSTLAKVAESSAAAQERVKVAERELHRLQAEAREISAAGYGAASRAGYARQKVENELRETAHPDIAEILRVALSLEEGVRHATRTHFGAFDRNVLGHRITHIWSNLDDVMVDVERIRAIAAELRRLQVSAYPATLVEILRARHDELAGIAKRWELRLVKIETISGIEDATL